MAGSFEHLLAKNARQGIHINFGFCFGEGIAQQGARDERDARLGTPGKPGRQGRWERQGRRGRQSVSCSPPQCDFGFFGGVPVRQFFWS